jgi:Holliday junction resolvase RusA-like endonuclease
VLTNQPPTIVVLGRPVAKQRARMFPGGRAYTPPRTRDYEQTVAWACRATRERFRTGPLSVRILLLSTTELRGDVDNYAKSILDGMEKGQLIGNDRQIKDLQIGRAIGTTDEARVWVEAYDPV